MQIADAVEPFDHKRHQQELHTAGRAGIPVIARLKDNLPELSQSVERRFAPWETLHWDRVRVIRYRQHKPDKTIVQAQWLTDLPSLRVGSLSLYHLAKSRWEIENQEFNDAKLRVERSVHL